MKIESTPTQNTASRGASHTPTRDTAAASFFQEFLATKEASNTSADAAPAAPSNNSDGAEEQINGESKKKDNNTNIIDPTGVSVAIEAAAPIPTPVIYETATGAAARTSEVSPAVHLKSGIVSTSPPAVQDSNPTLPAAEESVVPDPAVENNNSKPVQETIQQKGIDTIAKTTVDSIVKRAADTIVKQSSGAQAPDPESAPEKKSAHSSDVTEKLQLIQKEGKAETAAEPKLNTSNTAAETGERAQRPLDLKNTSPAPGESKPVSHDHKPAAESQSSSTSKEESKNPARDSYKNETKNLNELFNISPAGGDVMHEVPSSTRSISAVPQAAESAPPAEGILNVTAAPNDDARQNILFPKEVINLSPAPVVDLLRSAAPAAPVQPASTTSQLDEAAAQAETILKQIRVHLRNGITELQIRLDPPGLGELTIRFAYDAGRVRGRVRATDSATATLVRDHAGDLKLAMREAGIDITDLDVGADRGASHRNPSLEEMKESAERDHHNRRRFFLNSSDSGAAATVTTQTIVANRAQSPRSLDLVV
ncbi:MAG: flagellar hook-length control protein FliK [Planctomycetota bacterium]